MRSRCSGARWPCLNACMFWRSVSSHRIALRQSPNDSWRRVSPRPAITPHQAVCNGRATLPVIVGDKYNCKVTTDDVGPTPTADNVAVNVGGMSAPLTHSPTTAYLEGRGPTLSADNDGSCGAAFRGITNLWKGACIRVLVEQQLSNFRLILSGRDVQRCVAVL